VSVSRWVPPVLWAGVIVALSSWPQPPEFGAPPGTDKVVHGWMYAVLAFLSVRAAWSSRTRWTPWVLALAVLAGAVLFAAADEWHQRFIPTRSAELFDWLADAVGALVGVAAYRLTMLSSKARPEAAL